MSDSNRKMSVGWCLGLVFGLVVAGAGPVGAQTERPAFVPGEVLIKLKDGTPRQRIAWILSRVGGQVMHRYRLTGALRVRLRKKTVAAAIGWLRRLSQVEYAEPNYVRYADLIPDDPQFPDLWGLDNTGQTGGLVDADIDAPEAWDITPGDPGIVVAVIDSGIDLSHPDLNIWTNPGEISGNGIDDDGNGFVDDVHGWDFADDDNDPTDSTPTVCASHGTHTAGTIGARGNNGLGVTGVNLDVTIMPLRALRRRYLVFCAGFDSDFIGAIQYAADKGVRISNNSYGSGPFSQAVFEAIRASKSIFVAAAGNDATDNDFNPSYPASYDLGGVISVAATDDSDLLAGFSNFGLNGVDLGAPGVDILSTVTGGYGVLSGTSMASPHVAGAAALLLASDPSLTNHEIVWRLANTTDFTNLPVASGGRLNVFNAIMFSPVVTIGLTPLGPTTAAPGETIDYSVRVANTGASAKTVHASVMVIFPDGHEFVLQERSLTVPGGVSRSENFSEMVPLSFPAGHYQLAARAQVATESYDEDVVDYELQ